SLRQRVAWHVGVRGMLAILVLREKHSDALVRERRVTKLSSLRRREEQRRPLDGRNGDFKKHRDLVSPSSEVPLVAESQHDIPLTDNQGCRYRFDHGVLKIT